MGEESKMKRRKNESGFSLLFLLMTVILGLGCSERTQETPNDRDKKSVKTSVKRLAEPEKSGELRTRERLGSGQAVVGGCRRECEEGPKAFLSYMRALSRGEKGLHSIPFLETSEMVFNGQRRGDEWIELWKAGENKTRRASIVSFAGEAHSWLSRVAPDALEVSLANHVTYSEDDGPGILVFWKPPKEALSEGDQAEWRYRIQKRGWEWLVSEIQTKEDPLR